MELNFARSSSCAAAKNVLMTSTTFCCSLEEGCWAIPESPLTEKMMSTKVVIARVVCARSITTISLMVLAIAILDGCAHVGLRNHLQPSLDLQVLGNNTLAR